MTNNNIRVSKEELASRKELAKHLKHKDVVLLSQILETTPSNVTNYIHGRNSSERVKIAFEKLSNQRKKEFEEKFNRLTKI